MRRALLSILSATALSFGLLAATGGGTANAAPQSSRDRLDVYVGELTPAELEAVVDLGVDRHDLSLSRVAGQDGDKALIRVETVLSTREAAKLRRQGIDVRTKKVDGQTVAQRATALAAEGFTVWSKYSGPGGLKEQYEAVAAANPKITKLVTIGQTVQGQDIIALKVTKDARYYKDGKKPSVLYLSAQHAREWITPEMTRRLMLYVVDGYGKDQAITRLLNEERAVVRPGRQPGRLRLHLRARPAAVAQEPPRQRRRRHDHLGRRRRPQPQLRRPSGATTTRAPRPTPAARPTADPAPTPSPRRRPSTSFIGRVGFEFFVNYHSAAELLLYGTGWQVATPTPDDVIYETMAGDDENPAVPGYDPDISAELYTTNGDTDTHMTELYGTLGFTPEMSTCERVSDSIPDDEWVAEDCGSGFEFPDDEGLVQAEFEKNIPFALSVAESASDPDDPMSVVGLTAPDFVVDSFDVSYGDPQTVAVVAKRAIKRLRMRYRIDGGRIRTTRAPEWAGGERYGDENDDYYAEFRGKVRGADPGDEVEVWFSGIKPGARLGRAVTASPTPSASDTGHDVLVIANEDYTGVNPTYPAGTTAPKYAAAHVAAVEAAGYSADVWDVDAQGVPHDLGVLDHYDAVLWYLGDNRITKDPEDVLTSTPFGDLPDISVAERQQYLTIAVRDYLNSGGKLIHAGETAQYQGLPGISTAVGGLYYGLNGDPSAECVIDPRPGGSTAGFFEDCLILADDFRQYYLGAFNRTDIADPTGVAGIADPIDGFAGTLGGPVVEGDNPLDEAGSLQPTSDVLPVGEFPQFASQGAARYPLEAGSPFAPVEGTRYAGAVHADASYMRLTRTVDIPAGSAASLDFQLSADIEPGYDFVIVEARSAGGSDWTTLPESGGLTATDSPTECDGVGSFLLAQHPFLTTYLGEDCNGTGATGDWNAILDSTPGWTDVSYDLSGFSGPVEVSISYVTDPGTGGVGVFVDDTRVVVDGVADADGFEDTTSVWTPGGPPAGSPPNSGNWAIGEVLFQSYAATSTEDTLLLGFGLEQLSTAEERADLVGQALDGLLD